MLTLREVGGGSVDRRSGVSNCRFPGVCGVTGPWCVIFFGVRIIFNKI